MSEQNNRGEGSGPEPTVAKRARALADRERVGTLSTISRRHDGWPFGSVMQYITDESGKPMFFVSVMAMHTKNIDEDDRVSLLIAESSSPGDEVLAKARLTIVGRAARVNGDVERFREKYLQRHPQSQAWIDFGDFVFYRMEIVDLYYVGGFGVQQWIEPQEYARG